MKLSFLYLAALVPSFTVAYPSNLLKGDISDEALAEISALVARASKEAKEAHTKRQFGLDIVKPVFNAKAQRINTTGEHRFIAPGPDDLRGPCPGLNALANHGYIPRNGVASAVQVALASNQVFGMTLDLSTVLSVYSAVISGDLTSFSIGGKPKNGGLVGGLLGGLGLLGEPQGLSASHNRFEADASATRADLYKTGDPNTVNIEQFEQLYAMPLGPNGYDTSVMRAFKLRRFNDSIATNGYFFAGPFTHLAIGQAAYFFTYRYFANCSVEYPEGYLDGETLKTFEGVKGKPGSFQKMVGHERIPDNWYRRAIGDEYGILGYLPDAIDTFLHHPELLVVGGNTGKPNSFVGVNVGDLTGGVFNALNLLQDNNLMCFALMALNEAAPDILRGLVGNVLAAVEKLADVLTPVLESLACPQLLKYDPILFKQFPGAGTAL